MRIAAPTLTAVLTVLATAAPAHAQGTEPAGGAALGEVLIASGAAGALTIALLVLGIGHRSGRIDVLERAAAFAGRQSGMPGWAALPSLIAAVALVTAVIGMYWDIALHIDVGRDAGPLANPAHYFILAGLFGIFSAGWAAIVLPRERPSGSAVRIASDWHAPLGGVLIAVCGAFALLGFPLDDVWHRLFGQDVTLWGPTHLMLIGGASMTIVGIAVLLVEGARANRATHGSGGRERGWISALRRVALTGALLLGLSTFQAEFDFGVPQFRFLFQPVLIMLAAGVALVAVRLWAGRGAALGAVAFFLAIRGALALLIGPVIGETTPHFPLYVVEALVVEAVALRVGRERPLTFALAAGIGIGTIGLAAEWGWSHVWMPLPWPATLLPEAAVLGLATAIASALIGAWIGVRLTMAGRLPAPRLRVAAVAGALAVAGIVAFSLNTSPTQGVRADVALADAGGGPGRTVSATVTIEPAAATADADWLTMTAWQGGGLVVDRLTRVAPGQYRTNEPIPVDGEWKALVRLHEGSSLLGVPIFLPRDAAIPAAEVPAEPRVTRAFVADNKLLQREQKAAAPALKAVAYGAVVAIALALLALLAWGLHRLSTAAVPGPAPSPSPRPRARTGPRTTGRPIPEAGR